MFFERNKLTTGVSLSFDLARPVTLALTLRPCNRIKRKSLQDQVDLHLIELLCMYTFKTGCSTLHQEPKSRLCNCLAGTNIIRFTHDVSK